MKYSDYDSSLSLGNPIRKIMSEPMPVWSLQLDFYILLLFQENIQLENQLFAQSSSQLMEWQKTQMEIQFSRKFVHLPFARHMPRFVWKILREKHVIFDWITSFDVISNELIRSNAVRRDHNLLDRPNDLRGCHSNIKRTSSLWNISQAYRCNHHYLTASQPQGTKAFRLPAAQHISQSSHPQM